MRFNMLSAILVGFMISPLAFAATDAELAEYETWATTFNQLGLHPTPEEIRQKAKALHLNDEQIAEAIKFQNSETENKADEVVLSSGAVHAKYLTVANKAAKSKSEEVIQMGREIKKLLDEVRHEKDIRDVDGFASTQARLRDLASKLNQQIEAEKL